MTLREGFTAPQDLCESFSSIRADRTSDQVLCAPLPSLLSIEILPDYPTSCSPLAYAPPVFPFGMQLLKTAKPCTSLAFGLPLESTTNPSSRQNLKALKPKRLSLTFVKPTVSLFTELASLIGDTVDLLTIRYLPIRGFVDGQMFLCDPLQSFRRIEIHVLMPHPRMIFVGAGDSRTLVEDPESPGKRFTTAMVEALEMASEEIQSRYTIWMVDEWDVPGRAHKAVKTKLWPKEALWDLDTQGTRDLEHDDPPTVAPVIKKGKEKQTHWERETNLKLLGGLFSLRLESKKR